MMRPCSIDGCNAPAKGRGWCQIHYLRWYAHGDPNWTPPTPAERFYAKVDSSAGPDGCWPWTGFIERNGYGRLKRKEGQLWAHRVSYELAFGGIPDGLELDHVCHDPRTCVGGYTCPHRRCVNPAHLVPATYTENHAPERNSLLYARSR